MAKPRAEKKIYVQLLDQILNAVRSGTLQAGDRLPPERTWSEKMNVSRATIRETIRALEMTGLVQCRQGEGNFLSNNFSSAMAQPLSLMFWLKKGETREIHEFRKMLEIEAARLAAKNGTDEELEELKKIHSKMLVQTDKTYRAQMDQNFHFQIGKMAHNCLLEETLGSASALIENMIAGLREQIVKKDHEMKRICEQHDKILNAVIQRDSEQASQAMREHMTYVEEFMADLNLF